jgi:uncharacterized SAM-binding protein YcdF (DUF218 family)
MTELWFAIKGLINTLSFLMAFLFVAICCWRLGKRKLARILIAIDVVVFLLCSTAYLPKLLARNMEKKFSPFSTGNFASSSLKTYILILGSGINQDENLPYPTRLGPAAQGRVLEAIRIHKLLPHGILVGSGGKIKGKETQSAVVNKALINLGIDSKSIEQLNLPLTTKEEANEMYIKYGAAINLIVVTDAIHMQRALMLFTQEGFRPVPAPCNYKTGDSKEGGGVSIDWWPRIDNISLMDKLLHEFLGILRFKIL